MELPESGNVNDLARYRLETAKSDLNSAQILIREKEYRGANNRAYYAIYHAISAIHALDGISYKRHKDTLANVNGVQIMSVCETNEEEISLCRKSICRRM